MAFYWICGFLVGFGLGVLVQRKFSRDVLKALEIKTTTDVGVYEKISNGKLITVTKIEKNIAHFTTDKTIGYLNLDNLKRYYRRVK